MGWILHPSLLFGCLRCWPAAGAATLTKGWGGGGDGAEVEVRAVRIGGEV